MADNVEIKGDLNMSFEAMTRIFPKYAKAALYAGAAVIKDQTERNLMQRLPKARQPNPLYNDTLADAIWNTKSDGAEVDIHIMGTRAQGSGTFRTRFFENGTQDRYAKTYKGKKLKKPRYLGKIKPKYFFKDAVNSSEQAAVQAMQPIINRFFEQFK